MESFFSNIAGQPLSKSSVICKKVGRVTHALLQRLQGVAHYAKITTW